MTKKIDMVENGARTAIRVLQLSDSHLFSEQSATLLGLNTEASFLAILEDVHQRALQPDVVLLTGDLSQDRSLEAYERLKGHITQAFSAPCFWIPGNHDDYSVMLGALNGQNIYDDKHIVVGQWNIILLNSQVVRKVHGWLDESQMLLLRDSLQAYPTHYPLIVMHHHPIDMKCDWIDTIGIRNAEHFWKILEDEIKQGNLLWGHVHQELDIEYNGFRCMSTPSTCVQFKPRSPDFSADDIGPGYRILDLMPNGHIDTQVYRVNSPQFAVDHSIKGY